MFVALAYLTTLLSTAPATELLHPSPTAINDDRAAKGLACRNSVFIENKGQWAPEAKFMARMEGLNLWVTNTGLVYDWGAGKDRQPIYVDFVGASGLGKPEGVDARPGHFNFYHGKIQATNVKSYGEATIKDLYPGIDLVTYFDKIEKGPRYDFVVHPGADPNQVRMRYRNAKNLRVDKDGALIYDLKGGQVAERRQMAYQKGDRGADFHFFPQQQIDKDGTVSFDTTGYRKDRTLVIDPLIWSNLLAGDGTSDTSVDQLTSVPNVALFISGHGSWSNLTGFLSTGASKSSDPDGSSDCFFGAFSPDGTMQLFTEYGGSGNDYPSSLVFEKDFGVTIAGTTTSTDFAGATGSADTGFVIKFNVFAGTLGYAKYIPSAGRSNPPLMAATPTGGVTIATGIGSFGAVLLQQIKADGTFGSSTQFPATGFSSPVFDSQGKLYVGLCLPITSNFTGASSEDIALGTTQMLIACFSADLRTTTSLALLGVTGQQSAAGLTIDGNDNIIAAVNLSPNANGHLSAPSVAGWQSNARAIPCGYIAKLSNDLSTIQSASSFADPAGNAVKISSLSLDSNGKVVFAESGCHIMPLTYDYFSGHATAQGVVKMFPDLSAIAYATYFGGDSPTPINSVAQLGANVIYIAGATTDPNFPLLFPNVRNAPSAYPGRSGPGYIAYTAAIDTTTTTGLTRIATDRGTAPALAGGVGKSVTVSVYFTEAPGTSVTLTSPDPNVQVNGGTSGTYHVVGSERVATFTVTANDVASPLPVVLAASDGNGSTLPLTVTVQPFLRTLVTRPPTAASGSALAAYVYPYEQPATSQVVSFSGDVPGAVLPGQSCTIAGLDKGKTSGPTTTTINLGSVDSTTTVTLAATASTGSTALSAFTMNPIQIQSMGFAFPSVAMGGSQTLNMMLTGAVPTDTTVVVNPANKQLGQSLSLFFPAGTSFATVDFNASEYIGVEGSKSVSYSATVGGAKATASFQMVTSGFTFVPDRTDVGEGNPVTFSATTQETIAMPESLVVNSTAPGTIPGFTLGVSDPSGSQTISTAFAGLTSSKVVRMDSAFVAADGSLITPVHSATVTVHPELTSITLSTSTVQGGSVLVGQFNLFEPCMTGQRLTVLSNSPLVTFSGGSTGTAIQLNRGGSPTVSFVIFTKPVTRKTSVLLTFPTPLGYKTRSLSVTLTP